MDWDGLDCDQTEGANTWLGARRIDEDIRSRVVEELKNLRNTD